MFRKRSQEEREAMRMAYEETQRKVYWGGYFPMKEDGKSGYCMWLYTPSNSFGEKFNYAFLQALFATGQTFHKTYQLDETPPPPRKRWWQKQMPEPQKGLGETYIDTFADCYPKNCLWFNGSRTLYTLTDQCDSLLLDAFFGGHFYYSNRIFLCRFSPALPIPASLEEMCLVWRRTDFEMRVRFSNQSDEFELDFDPEKIPVNEVIAILQSVCDTHGKILVPESEEYVITIDPNRKRGEI